MIAAVLVLLSLSVSQKHKANFPSFTSIRPGGIVTAIAIQVEEDSVLLTIFKGQNRWKRNGSAGAEKAMPSSHGIRASTPSRLTTTSHHHHNVDPVDYLLARNLMRQDPWLLGTPIFYSKVFLHVDRN